MLTKLNCSVSSFTHILHVADIHVRLTNRIEEYNEIFDKLYVEVKKSPETTLIAVLGDVLHSKSDLSPECVQMASKFLNGLANLRPTVLISGNHDATLTNKNRLDSLTPIVDAINNPNLFYLKDNGLYSLGDILFNVMSVFSDITEYLSYKDIPKKYKNEFRHHLALYHGPVNSALTDLGFYLVNKAMPIDKFDGHHIVLLGDIHKKQDLQHYNYDDGKPAVHYPGSLIQQNHGESIDGHGFSLWDLKTKTYSHVNIPNDYGFFTVEVNRGKLVTDLTNIPKKARVHVKCFESVQSEVKAAVQSIKLTSNVDELSYSRVESEVDQSKSNTTVVNLTDIVDVTYQNKLLTDFLKDKCKVTDESIIKSVLDINTKLNSSVVRPNIHRNVSWKPKKFEFSNMFSYGEDNVVDFSKAADIMGLFADNASGKSSLFSALSFCLFDKFDRGYKASHVLNVQKSTFKCKLNFEINGVDFFIEREGKADKKGSVKVEVSFWKVVDGKDVSLTGKDRSATNDVIVGYIGTYEDFILTSLSVQSGKNSSSFIDMDQSDRKDLLSQLIGLVIFDSLLELAKDESKNISTSLKIYKSDDCEGKLKSNEDELSLLTNIHNDESAQLESLNNQRQTINEQIVENTKRLIPIDCRSIDVDEVKQKIVLNEKNIDALKKAIDSLTTEISNKSTVVSDLSLKINDLETKDISSTYKLYQKRSSELSHIDQVLGVKKVEVGNKISKLDMLKKHEYDPNCKFCVNSVFVKDANKISGELESDKVSIKSLLDDRTKIKTELENLSWVITAQEEYSTLLKNKNNITGEINSREKTIQQNKTTILKLESDVVSMTKNIEDYNKQIESIKSNTQTQLEIDGLTQNLRNLEFNITQKSRRLIEVSSKINTAKSEINRLNSTIKKVKELEKENISYELYLKSVHRDGLPYMVIQNTVPEIEREVNNILNQIVEFHIKFEMDGKNIIPFIVYDDKRWPIEMASGFEKFVSSLAIRVALINISNLPKVPGLIIDEGFGVIDGNNMSSIQTLFSFLKTNFEFIIIISHLDALRDIVDKHIEIKKDNGFSSVNFI